MAFLVLTRAGLDSLVEQYGGLPANLWVNEGVLSGQELADIRAEGGWVTHFTYFISPTDRAGINAALDTIADHHPGEAVFAEWTDC